MIITGRDTMVYRLVTVAQARAQLNYDGTYADSAIRWRLEQVSRAIYDYIGEDSLATDGWTDTNGPLVDTNGDPLAYFLLVDTNGDPLLDSNGDKQYEIAGGDFDSSGNYVGCVSVVPGQVQAAVICALARWDEDRTADIITPAVVSLLNRTRDPAVL